MYPIVQLDFERPINFSELRSLLQNDGLRTNLHDGELQVDDARDLKIYFTISFCDQGGENLSREILESKFSIVEFENLRSLIRLITLIAKNIDCVVDDDCGDPKMSGLEFLDLLLNKPATLKLTSTLSEQFLEQ